MLFAVGPEAAAAVGGANGKLRTAQSHKPFEFDSCIVGSIHVQGWGVDVQMNWVLGV